MLILCTADPETGIAHVEFLLKTSKCIDTLLITVTDQSGYNHLHPPRLFMVQHILNLMMMAMDLVMECMMFL